MNQVTLVLLVTMVNVMFMTSPAFGRSTRCARATEPDFNKLVFDDKLHPTFYQLPPLRALLENSSSEVPDEFKCPLFTYLQGPRQCPTWDSTVRQYGGTLCPSYHVINHDENRYPPTLVEARCSCNSCLSHPDDNLRSELECKPVYYYTPVFRRVGCIGNVYQYKPVWEALVVACSCSALDHTVVGQFSPSRPARRS